MASLLRSGIGATLLVLAAVSSGCRGIAERMGGNDRPPDTNVQRGDSQAPPTAHLTFGTPSSATADPANADDYLVVHDGYTLSYNNSRGTSNWVAWRTSAPDLGERRERRLFQPDQTLPRGFRQIQYYDYSGSGYDRGHMVPAADRFGDEQRMEETFLMTNIVPQTGDLNQFPWNKLESYSRGIVRKGNDTYTIAGVYGEKGRLRNKVTIPTNCWKVILVLPRGSITITERSRIIAVDMPNIDGIQDARWETYKTTVRQIEQKTGLDIFSSLPRTVQDIIENQ